VAAEFEAFYYAVVAFVASHRFLHELCLDRYLFRAGQLQPSVGVVFPYPDPFLKACLVLLVGDFSAHYVIAQTVAFLAFVGDF
jgi:hypothetical protein